MRRLIRQRPDINGITEGVIWKQLLLFFCQMEFDTIAFIFFQFVVRIFSCCLNIKEEV